MADSSYRKGFVYVQQMFAGIIEETESGYSFNYDRDYLNNPKAVAVSLTMPLTNKEYKSNILFPFFDGLIPEGWLLNIALKNWKLSSNDRFGLLLSVCKDCIGDVYVLQEQK